MIRRFHWRWVGLSGWVALLILFFYGAALALPFMADDYFHLPFVDSHSIAEMWRSAGGLYYFRPVSFTLWKIMEPIFGFHNAVAQHALNLTLHWANALLTAWLAGVLWATNGKASGWRQFLSATLYVLFPFSYEAVPWVGSLVHPLVTFVLLVSVAAYVKMRVAGSRQRALGWAALSLASAYFGPFTHENGILIVPLLGAIEVTWPAPSSTLWRRLLRVAVWLIPLAIWFIIYRSVPAAQGGGVFGINRPAEIWRNFVYAAQGSVYPITWLGGWLTTQEVRALNAALGLSVLGAIAAVLIQWRTHAGRRGWLPWLWIGLAVLPALLFLTFDYFSAAPRTLMLASVGIAWLWTDVLVRLAGWGRPGTRRRAVSAVAAIGLAVGLLAQNGLFIQSQMKLYHLAGEAVRQVVTATVTANRQGQAATFINLPVWITAPQLNYALGQEGVVFGPAPDLLATMVSVHTGQPARMNGLRIEAIHDPAPYYVGLLRFPGDWRGLEQNGGQVFVTRYLTDTIVIQPAGELNAARPASPALTHFDQSVTLLSVAARRTANGAEVELTWQVDQPPALDVTVFVHVLDATGQLIAQADGDPLANTYPFAQWPRGSIGHDVRPIDVVDPAAIRVGLYNRTTGKRLTALASAGETLPDNAVSLPLQERLP